MPGDFSSAAPFIVAATLVPGSELHVHGVNLNPRRTGLLDDPRADGRDASRSTTAARSAASRAAISRSTRPPLVGTTVGAKEVPLAIDELPLFALAAACARGESVLRGAEELRAKETDRIEATVDALRPLGARARANEDGFSITGVPARLRGGRIDSRGDHRIAMLGAVAGLASREGVRDRGRRRGGGELPGVLRDAWNGFAVPLEISGNGASRDRRHRRARRALARAPSHGRSPRGSASTTSTRARCTARSRGSRCTRASPLDDGPALEALAQAHPVTFGDGGLGRDRRRGRDDAHPRAGDRRRRPGRRPASGGARGDARASARARPLGRLGDRGPRHRRRRRPGRGGQGLARGRPGRARAPDDISSETVSGSRSSPRSCGDATSATPSTRIVRTTRSRSTRRR